MPEEPAGPPRDRAFGFVEAINQRPGVNDVFQNAAASSVAVPP
jgi:hypothetical protein